MKTEKITIKKGWFFTAGRGYWGGEHSLEGIGLNQSFFNSDVMEITVLGKEGGKARYKVDTQVARDFINKHRSFKRIGTAKVGFIPRTLMTEVE